MRFEEFKMRFEDTETISLCLAGPVHTGEREKILFSNSRLGKVMAFCAFVFIMLTDALLAVAILWPSSVLGEPRSLARVSL